MIIVLSLLSVLSCAKDAELSGDKLEALLSDMETWRQYYVLLMPSSLPLIRDRSLLVFRTEADATAYKENASDASAAVETKACKGKDLAKYLVQLKGDNRIDSATVYWRAPIGVMISNIDQLTKRCYYAGRNRRVTFEEETERVRKVLQTISEQERLAEDENHKLYSSNGHGLVRYFVEMFNIPLSAISEQTGLDEDRIRTFCEDLGASDLFDRKEFRKLFDYFGLGDYIYLFKNDCDEINVWVNNHSLLDSYPINFPTIDRIREIFEIKRVTRGKSDEDDAYIYRISLQAKTRNLEVFLTNPTNCVVGRKCEVLNLPETIDDHPERNESQRSSNLTEDKIEQAKKDFASGSGRGSGRRKTKPTQTGIASDEV